MSTHPYPGILTVTQMKRAVAREPQLAAVKPSRFDLGKYARNMANESVPAHMLDRVHLVWCERRADKDGPYWALRCLAKERAA